MCVQPGFRPAPGAWGTCGACLQWDWLTVAILLSPQHQHRYLELACALSTTLSSRGPGPPLACTHLDIYDHHQSQDALQQAQDAFRKAWLSRDEKLQ